VAQRHCRTPISSLPADDAGRPRQGEANAKKDVILFVLLLTAVTLAAQSRKLRPGFNLFSKEQDIQLGKERPSAVEKKMKVLDSPERQACIATVGKKLTSSENAGEFPYSFKVEMFMSSHPNPGSCEK
jgi:hypothetical protein